MDHPSPPEPPSETEFEEPTIITPPAVRYRVLSVVWCFPSLGAAWLLGIGLPTWKFEQGIAAGLAGIRIEEWVAILLLGLHVLWLTRWWRANRRN
ncbi:MAG: hypothetical protein JNN07_25280 [Verrucomicrobiales bacterium]|nr:hypothetical protein [Verrucomicrobiales bacterium]